MITERAREEEAASPPPPPPPTAQQEPVDAPMESREPTSATVSAESQEPASAVVSVETEAPASLRSKRPTMPLLSRASMRKPAISTKTNPQKARRCATIQKRLYAAKQVLDATIILVHAHKARLQVTTLEQPPQPREQRGLRLGATRTGNRSLSKHSRPATMEMDQDDDFVTMCREEALTMYTSVLRSWTVVVELLQRMHDEASQ